MRRHRRRGLLLTDRAPDDDAGHGHGEKCGLGALFSGAASALNPKNRTNIEDLPRLADFCAWTEAAWPGLGWERGEFLSVYRANRSDAVEAAIESDPLADALLQLVRGADFEGTPTALLDALNPLVSERVQASRLWPSPNKLRGRLRRCAPTLRASGIVMDLDTGLRGGGRANSRWLSIRVPSRSTSGPAANSDLC